MTFNIRPYRQAHEKKVQEMYLERGIDSISFYCAVSYCPVVAAYTFCREIDPANEELTKRIDSVKLFYGVGEVVDET